MRSQPIDNTGSQQIQRWMNVVLFGTIIIESCLMISHLLTQQEPGALSSTRNMATVFSLSLLMLYVVLKATDQTRLNRELISSKCETDALASLLITVKHELNNEMQVVVGNAELAEVLLRSGADVEKPVSSIVRAASAAIVRIDQLSVFDVSNRVLQEPVDLNSILRQSAAQLTKDLPPDVKVRLELARLPARIAVDGHLFTLSLMHLINRTADLMDSTYEIVLRTSYQTTMKLANGRVGADVLLIRQGVKSEPLSSESTAAFSLTITTLLIESAALMNLSGAMSVGHECTDSVVQLSMRFQSESPPVEV